MRSCGMVAIWFEKSPSCALVSRLKLPGPGFLTLLTPLEKRRWGRVSTGRLVLPPQCIVFLKSASVVSRIVRLSAGMRAKAAIGGGGGHTPIANVADINNTGNIDFIGMNVVRL